MIPLGGFRRLLNGELRYLGAPDGYKIQTKIRCQDRNIPAFHALRPGMPVDVGCVTTLTQPWQGPGVLTLDRPAVPGSVFVWNTKGAVAVESLSSQTLGLTELPNTSGDDEALRYVTYRPMLSMLLVSCRLSVDEWSVSSHWELELDER